MNDAQTIQREIDSAGPDRRFPILSPRMVTPVERDRLGLWIAWDIVEPLRAVAKRVHGQSLERLAVRGGLSRAEIATLQAVAILDDSPIP